jgi:2-oxoglutarate dehydrogenase E2 component (dihydrolipoamide succinyltransferase)
MQPIIVPTLNSNDIDARLVSWSKDDGDNIHAGETLAVLETTKAAFDLAAETSGVLHTVALAGERCAFGATIGWIFADAGEREQFIHRQLVDEPAVALPTDYVLTKAAEALVMQHNLPAERLRALGKRVIKAGDIERLLAAPQATAPTGSALLIPSEAQQSIARVVSRSRATIPDSFLVKKIAVDAALTALAEFGHARKVLLGLPDLLVWVVARLAGEFPFFFGELRDDLSFAPSSAGNIGVTFDLGHGLFIPVLREAASKSLPDIAKALMTFRVRAMRGKFDAGELRGGDLTISLNMDADIVFVQPVILPPQTCMLAVGSMLPDVTLNSDGMIAQRRCLQLGVAFDHRVINGFHANAFANAIKMQIEQPTPDAW